LNVACIDQTKLLLLRIIINLTAGGNIRLEKSDIELISESISGDQDAFAEIVSRYKKLVYSVVYNIMDDKQEVSDVSQEVFIRIYKSMDRYNPEFKFSTWCVKIATNLCLDTLRKRKVTYVPLEDAEGICSNSETPEDKALRMERSRRIREAITELPEKYRIPIVLFHQNGMSYEEMVKILNEPMTIIKNRLYRARLMLREKLMPYRNEEVL
jgi:RNA polymerase sigma factor (sigma-70 family)